MSYTSKLHRRIEAGKRGDFAGLHTGLEGIETLQRGVKYVIGGGTGAGKSHFAVNHYGWEPFMDWYEKYRNDPSKVYHWFYFTLEMSEDDILLRLASYILYRAGVFRIERNSDNTPYYYYYPAKEIGSKGKHTITSQLERLIEQYVDPVFKDLEKYLTVIETATVSTMSKVLHRFYQKHGTVRTNENGQKHYFTDKHITAVAMVDHGGLLDAEDKESVKSRMDSGAALSINTSRLYKTSWVWVQQLNRNEGSANKLKVLGMVRPTLDDFQETGDITKAAEVVYAVFSPARYNQDRYLLWDIGGTGLGEDARFLFCLKGREMPANVTGCVFYGEVGCFEQLPRINKETPGHEKERIYKEVRERVYKHKK